MIRILKDYDLQSLEANINGIIREEYSLKVKDIKIETSYGKDYFDDGRICNQWVDYVGIIIFENK